jgi:TonB family protein
MMQRTDRSAGLALLLSLFCAVSAAADDGAPSVTYLPDGSGERKPLHTVVPAYPELARRERVEGEVQVCFNINRAGKTHRVSVRRSTNRIFEKPSVKAVRASTFMALPEGAAPSGIKTCRTFIFRLTPVAVETPP